MSSMGLWRYKDQICVLMDTGIKREIMDESYTNPYSLHLGNTKMYRDLMDLYWWPLIKRDVTEYVIKCLTYQQVKVEHQRPVGLQQPLDIPEWKYQSTIGVAPYEMLYDRKCRSSIHWNEMGERKYLGPKGFERTTEAIEKIRAWMFAS
ncbi:uncharacterized protein LOC133814730 [Humulus lupulus]|uniref:uncharacterized protein LOC133814730 n=1 Tax=Humulus lupulus TaxID=3486 RepID=UPI002B40654A|nr:uncharacterized protein LOC133814730 [Humulus lupulus]